MKQIDDASRITRRETLKTAAAFMILPAGLARGYAANQKLNIGVIGLAGMGRVNAQELDKLGDGSLITFAADACSAVKTRTL